MKDIKVRQHDKEDCGAACLSSVSSYYGLNLPLITIRDACGTNKGGTNIKGLIDASQKIGLSAKAFKANDKKAASLIGIPTPAILHIQKGDGWLHFVVLYGINSKNITIMDPGDGELHKIPISKFEKEWTGYVIVLSPTADFQKGDKRGNIWGRFKELFIINRRDLIQALLGSIVYIAIGLSTSLFLQQIIDKVLPTKETSLLLFFGVAMFTLLTLSIAIGYFRNIFILRASLKIDSRLVMNYMEHLLRLPVSFFNSRSSGELNARIGDAYRIRSFLAGRLMIIFISIISLFVSFALLFTFYWKLAVLTLIFVPLYCILYAISDKINKRVNKKIIEASAKFEEVNIESLSAIQTIKYFGASESFARKIEDTYVSMVQKLYQGGKNLSLFSTSSDMITKIMTFTILIVGSIFVFNGELTIGELVSFYSIAGFFSSPLIALVDSSNQITEAKIAAQRLFEIMDLEVEDSGQKLNIDIKREESIFLSDISFTYPGRMPLIESLSMEIKSGIVTTVIGDNGSGKSTLASLLMRSYSPEKGTIKIGDIDIRQIPVQMWRKHISIVPQRADLFNGTLLENIVPNEAEPNIVKVLELCKKVGLDGLVNILPNGILNSVGERGCFLSGGEKQKLAFARALYRDPAALILDEATSSLDIESRKKINTLIRELADKGMAIIMISHDQESIELSDRIIDLSNKK